MIVIVLMGILAAIAIPSWFGLVASRNATSAANQVAADMRLANSKSTNRLTDWKFEVTSSGGYRTGASTGSLTVRPLDGATLSPTTVSLVFKPNGEVRKPDGTALANPTEITVRDSRGNIAYVIKINPQTSRVRID